MNRQPPAFDEREALDFHYANAPRAIVIARQGGDESSWHRFVGGHSVQLLEVVPPGRAALALDRAIAVDLIWVEADDEPLPEPLLARLQMLVRRGDIRLIWAATGAALEQGFAELYAPGTEYISQPSDFERVTAAALWAAQPRYRLNDSGSESDAVQIQKLTEEVNRIVRLLGDLSSARGIPFDGDALGLGGRLRSPAQGYAAEPAPETSVRLDGLDSSPVSASDVRNYIRIRRLRDHFFPSEIFSDPAWDMLLDLMAARLAQESVSVSSLCIAAAVPATTALRWIRTMTDTGLFIRHADPNDGRRVFIGLSDEAADGMMRYFAAVKAQSSLGI